jgi:methyl coenzyme M reductase subunit D
MFDYWYLSSILNATQKLPKEFIYAAIAGLTVNEAHKRYMHMKLEEVKANAKSHEIELEVEKLKLQLELHNTKIEKPLS